MIISFYVPERHIFKQKYIPLALRGRILPFVKKETVKLFIVGKGVVNAILV